MNKNDYLDSAFEAFNSGKVSPEAYDAMLMNADIFADDEDELEDLYSESELLFIEGIYDKYVEHWCKARGVRVEDVDFETGVNGECYVCFNEFVAIEFQDSEYMKSLLSEDDFALWENFVAHQNDELDEQFGYVEYVQPFKKYRIVLTCFDPGEEPYADDEKELFISQDEAHEKAKAMAVAECESLNELPDGSEIDGCFEIDDCSNNDFEVRWYEKKPEERDEGSCDINYITTYNIYPVEFVGTNESCKYRGFEINPAADGFAVLKDGVVFGSGENLFEALSITDDVCLDCTRDKTYALESVHKVPLDVVVKYTKLLSEKQNIDGPIKDAPERELMAR